jgi:hypothetical protein
MQKGNDMQMLLEDPAFRERARRFIETNIKAYCKGVRTKEELNTVKPTPNVGWCREDTPKHSRRFWRKFRERERVVARSKQIHTCKPAACLIQSQRGQPVKCKRKAPWTCSKTAYILSNGEWGPRRGYGYVNAWNPVIANIFGCNHDCKLLTNGQDSCKLTFYCTCYARRNKSGRIT